MLIFFFNFFFFFYFFPIPLCVYISISCQNESSIDWKVVLGVGSSGSRVISFLQIPKEEESLEITPSRYGVYRINSSFFFFFIYIFRSYNVKKNKIVYESKQVNLFFSLLQYTTYDYFWIVYMIFLNGFTLNLNFANKFFYVTWDEVKPHLYVCLSPRILGPTYLLCA